MYQLSKGLSAKKIQEMIYECSLRWWVRMGDGQKTENKGRQVKKKDYILKRIQIAASLSFLWKSWDRNIFNCSKYWKKNAFQSGCTNFTNLHCYGCCLWIQLIHMPSNTYLLCQFSLFGRRVVVELWFYFVLPWWQIILNYFHVF